MVNPKFYFQHDNHSREDEKLIEVRMKHQMVGIGVYWCLVEMLHESNGYIETKPKLLAFQLQVDEQVINDVIEICFLVEDDRITCNRVKQNLNERQEKFKKKQEIGRQNVSKRWNKDTNTISTDTTTIPNDSKVIPNHTIVIEIEKEKEIGKDKEIDKNKGKGIDIQKLKQQKLNEQKIRICKQLVEEGLFTNEYILTASLSDIREIISGVLDNEKWETEYLSGQYEFQLKLEDTNVWDYQIDALIKLYKLL